jgi:hypothetical protein
MKPGCLVIVLVFCLFMGVTAISMGVGAVVPAVNEITKPLVCPDGTMTSEVHSRRSRTKARQTIITRTWYCVDGSGSRTELGLFPMALYSGTVWGLALFVPLLALMALRGRPRPS